MKKSEREKLIKKKEKIEAKLKEVEDKIKETFIIGFKINR